MSKFKIFFVLMALISTFSVAGISHAQTIPVGTTINQLPDVKEGIMIVSRSRAVNIATVELAEYKGFALNGGLVGNDGIAATLTYDMSQLEFPGMELPVLNLVKFLNVGFGAGIKTITIGDAFADADNPPADNRIITGIVVQAKLKF